jgi:hypothetical protein
MITSASLNALKSERVPPDFSDDKVHWAPHRENQAIAHRSRHEATHILADGSDTRIEEDEEEYRQNEEQSKKYLRNTGRASRDT